MRRCLIFIFTLFALLLPLSPVAAQPFGQGLFNAHVPFGSQTSLAISTDGNVTIGVTPNTGGALGTATSTITVTSTDVVGYSLYISALSGTSMTNGAASLPASGNGTAAALSTNTWGYNTDASANFLGITSSNTLIKTATGPYDTGDNTVVTYGVKVDNSKPAGKYITSVVYTAAPQTN